MSDQQPPYYATGTPLPGSSVWPPPPSGLQQPITEPPAPDIRQFQVQNPWLLFLILLVTLNVYSAFWMVRTTKTINRFWPDLEIPVAFAWTAVGLNLAYFAGAFVLGLASGINPSLSSQTDIITRIGGYVVGIYELYVLFRIRGVLNQILRRTAPGETVNIFGGVGTWFFGALYLQIHLNSEIKLRQAKEAITSQGWRSNSA